MPDPTPPPEGVSYYKLEEVAYIFKCSVETVRWWVKQGKLASVRPGRRRLVPVEAVEEFIAGAERGELQKLQDKATQACVDFENAKSEEERRRRQLLLEIRRRQ